MSEPSEVESKQSPSTLIYNAFLESMKKPSSGDIDMDAFGRKIAPGWDSDVFYFDNNGREYALKFYKQNEELLDYQKGKETLDLYYQVTNSASENFNTVIKLEGSNMECEIQVNPILGVLWSDEYKCWVSVNEYHEGVNITQQGLRQVGETEQRDINKELTRIQEEIGKLSNVEGVKISETNCLWSYNQENNRINVIIVDLCPSLKLLKRKS